MTRTKSDDAVSPVIGVMLMLVVTVVIAGVVTIFATGMMTDTEPAPVAKFDVDIYSAYEISGGTVPNMHITLVSGDSIDSKDLKFTFSWECPHGDSCPLGSGGHHSSSYQYTGEERWGSYSSWGGSSPFGVDGAYSPSGYSGNTIEPLYINYGSSGGKFFGTHMWKRGETFVAFELHLPSGVLHDGNPAMDALLNNGDIIVSSYSDDDYWEAADALDEYIYGELYDQMGDTDEFWDLEYQLWEEFEKSWENKIKDVGWTITHAYTAGIMQCLPQGTAVDVMITHIPSNKLIYDGKVFVE